MCQEEKIHIFVIAGWEEKVLFVIQGVRLEVQGFGF